MTDFIILVLLSLLGGVVGLTGGIIFLVVRPWSRFLSEYSTSYAAGVLLTVSLVSVLPESVEAIGEPAYTITLFALIATFLFERVFFSLHHHEHAHDAVKESSVPIVIMGDTIHNFVDGVAIAASFYVSAGLGLVTALSTFLHEVPHEIGDFGVLLKAGWRRRHILIVNFLSALATLAGAVMVYGFVRDERVIGVLLAVSAGLFLYLGASDFLPHIAEGKSGKYLPIVVFLTGVASMLLILNLVPHGHEEGPRIEGDVGSIHSPAPTQDDFTW